MKKLKKTISLGIVVALLLSMFTIPQHASAAFNPISENFDSWTSLSDADTSKWSTTKSNVVTAGIGNGASLTAEEGHGNVLVLPNNDAQFAFHIGDAGEKDTNSYKLSFSYKSNNGDLYTWLAPWRESANPNPSLSGSTGLFKASGSRNGTEGGAWLTSSRNDVSDLTGFNSQWYLGPHMTGKWYKVEAILDFETRLIKMNFMDAEGNLTGTQTKAMDKWAYGHKLCFSNWSWEGTIYLDDITVEETSERITVLADENFETATNWKDVAGGLQWRHFQGYRNESQINNESCVVSTERNGVETKAYSSCGNANKVDWWAGGAITDGTWKLNFKFYLNGYMDSWFVGMADSSADSCGRTVRQQVLGLVYDIGNSYDASGAGNSGNENRKLTAFSTGNAGRGSIIAEPEQQTWYDYEVIIDLDNKIAHTSLSRDGKKIAGKRDFSLVGSPIENGFDRLGFFTWGGTDFYIDDLKVERLLDYKPTYKDYIISEEDFENMTDSDLTKNGWKFTRTANVGTIENGALKISANDTNLEKWITNTNNTDTIKVKYDVLAGGAFLADLIGNGVTHSGWYWTGAPLSAYINNGVYALETATHPHNKLAEATTTQWITVENVIKYNEDKDLNTITTTVRDKETGALLTAGEKGNPATVPAYNRTAYGTITNTNLQILRFISWSSATQYIDNVVVSYYYDEPTISDSQVTLKDVSGNTVTDFENVSTALKTVTLNFGAEMDEESANANISITDASGNEVGFIGENVDKAYELTLTDVLSAETEYTLKVNKEIESTLGVTLNKNYEFVFTTAEAECEVAKAELYSGDSELESISGLEKGATVTVKTTASNTYATDKSAVIMVGYYNGNRLVSVSLEPVTIPAGKITQVSKGFTLPDMTNVTDVNVFIWDSTSGMTPYCDVLSLGE